MGFYALEENMGKELIEYNRRREAPILNFNTDLMWSRGPGMAGNLFKNASINPYDEKNSDGKS